MSTNKEPATHRFQPLPTGKKVFDVVRPGKTPASPNSRAVVMPSSPEATDGQFVTVSAPPLPGAPSKEVKHPLITNRGKEVAAPMPEQESLPLPEVETPNEQEAQPAVQPEASDTRPAKVPSVVMLSEIDAVLESEPTEETEEPEEVKQEVPTEEEPEAPEEGEPMPEPAQEPAKGKRLSIRVHQDVEVSPEEVAEPSGAEPAVQADVVQSLAKPLTEEEIAAHLSHDDLLANTTAPHFDHENMVVSDHRHRMRVWQFVLIFLLIVVLALVALNFLLDAGIIKTELNLPHTNLLK